MTIHDLLESAENRLREDKEYWEQMDKLKNAIDKLLCQHYTIMAATIIRSALTMVTEEEVKKNDKDNNGTVGKR